MIAGIVRGWCAIIIGMRIFGQALAARIASMHYALVFMLSYPNAEYLVISSYPIFHFREYASTLHHNYYTKINGVGAVTKVAQLMVPHGLIQTCNSQYILFLNALTQQP